MIETIIQNFQLDNHPILIVVLGLTIGLIHAFEPDHLSALSTQLLKNKNYSDTESKKHRIEKWTFFSSLKGILWGMGHTSSIVLIGLLIAGMSLQIPENFFIGSEFVVAFMLILLGFLTLKNKTIFRQKHLHPHTHSNGISHTHPHSHENDHRHGHKTYIIGCIHGLAGSGGLVALAISTSSGFDMVMYFLILFGIGSIVGMVIASNVLGLPFIFLSKINSIAKNLRYVVAGTTLILGSMMVITLGFETNLI